MADLLGHRSFRAVTRNLGRFADRSEIATRTLGVEFTGYMTFDACCDVMAGQLALRCPDHGGIAECPDAIVVQSATGEHRFPIRDGGSSFIVAKFCPWCGTRLGPASHDLDRGGWRSDVVTLAQIGAQLFDAGLSLEVVLPVELARTAIDAWKRDDSGATADHETPAEAAERHRAGALALIGLAISQRGEAEGSSFTVRLDPWLIGIALDAADEANLIPPPRSTRD